MIMVASAHLQHRPRAVKAAAAAAMRRQVVVRPTAQLPLVPGPNINYPNFKPAPVQRSKKLILTMDGSGYRGMMTARWIEELEVLIKERIMSSPWIVDEAGKRPPENGEFNIHLADYFDLMAGTSSGSLLAAYLAAKGSTGSDSSLLNDPDVQDLVNKRGPFNPNQDKDVEAILDKFSKEYMVPGSCRALQGIFYAKVSKIFPQDALTTGVLGQLRAIFTAKYCERGVNEVLQTVFPDTGDKGRLSNSLYTGLLIPTYQLDQNRTVNFFYRPPTGTKGSAYGYATMRRNATVQEREDSKTMTEECFGDFIRKSSQKLAERPGWEEFGEDTSEFIHTPEMVFIPNVDFRLWDVIRSSTAAPTSFPVHKMSPAQRKVSGSSNGSAARPEPEWEMVDGGCTSNNPALSAAVFTTAVFPEVKSLRDIAVVSFGGGVSTGPVKVSVNAGALEWALPFINEAMFWGNLELTTANAQHLITFQYNDSDQSATRDPSSRFVRINRIADESGKGQPKTQDETRLLTLGGTSRTPAVLLTVIDDVDATLLTYQLAEETLRESKSIRGKLKLFVEDFVLPAPDSLAAPQAQSLASTRTSS